MNLADLNTATETTFDLELRHPATNAALGMLITHRSMDAPEVREVARRQGNEILVRNFRAQRKGKEEAPTVEEGVQRSAKLLAAAVTGWFEMKDGKRVEGLPFGETRLSFSQAEAEKLFNDPGYRWLRDQVDESVGDLGKFIAK